MKIEHITKKDLRALNLSWVEVVRVLEEEESEGMQLEYIRTRNVHPLIAFEEGMELAVSGHDPETDDWTIVTGFQSKQAMVARTHRGHLINSFKEFIRNGRRTQDEINRAAGDVLKKTFRSISGGGNHKAITERARHASAGT